MCTISLREPLVGMGAVSACERVRRIREDIAAAESKMERIRTRIERDRQALFHWEARLSAFQNGHKQPS